MQDAASSPSLKATLHGTQLPSSIGWHTWWSRQHSSTPNMLAHTVERPWWDTKQAWPMHVWMGLHLTKYQKKSFGGSGWASTSNFYMEVKNWFLTVKIRSLAWQLCPCKRELGNVFSCVPAKGNWALQKGSLPRTFTGNWLHYCFPKKEKWLGNGACENENETTWNFKTNNSALKTNRFCCSKPTGFCCLNQQKLCWFKQQHYTKIIKFCFNNFLISVEMGSHCWNVRFLLNLFNKAYSGNLPTFDHHGHLTLGIDGYIHLRVLFFNNRGTEHIIGTVSNEATNEVRYRSWSLRRTGFSLNCWTSWQLWRHVFLGQWRVLLLWRLSTDMTGCSNSCSFGQWRVLRTFDLLKYVKRGLHDTEFPLLLHQIDNIMKQS